LANLRQKKKKGRPEEPHNAKAPGDREHDREKTAKSEWDEPVPGEVMKRKFPEWEKIQAFEGRKEKKAVEKKFTFKKMRTVIPLPGLLGELRKELLQSEGKKFTINLIRADLNESHKRVKKSGEAISAIWQNKKKGPKASQGRGGKETHARVPFKNSF